MNPYTRVGFQDDEDKKKRLNPYTRIGFETPLGELGSSDRVGNKKKEKKGQGFFKDFAGFLGDTGALMTEHLKRTGEGIAEVGAEITGVNEQERARQAQSSEETVRIIRELGKKMQSAKTKEEKDRYKNAIRNIANIDSEQTKSFQDRQSQIIERADPVKGAAAVGEIGLDIITGGTGRSLLFGGKAAMKTGQLATKSNIAKNVADGLKTGRGGLGGAIDKADSYLNATRFGRGVNAFANPRGIKQGLVSGSGIGASYGALGTAENLGSEASPVDYLINTTIGGAMGGTLGVAGPAVGKGLSKLRSNRPSQIAKELDEAGGSYADMARREQKARKAGKTGWVERTRERISTQFYAKNGGLVREDRFAAKKSKMSDDAYRAKGYSLADKAVELRTTNNQVDIALNRPTADGHSIAKMIGRDGASTNPESAATATNGFLNDLYDLRVRGVIDNDYNIVNKSSGKQLSNDSAEQLQARIADYQSAHPEWRKDVTAVKQFMDDMIEIGVKSGAIKKDVAKVVKETYGNIAVPIERIFDEDLIRPGIAGGIRTNVGKDRILQALEGSNAPVSLSYDRFFTRGRTAVTQKINQNITNEILRRQRNGLLREGGELVVDPEKLRFVEGITKLRDEIKAEIKAVNRGISKDTTKKRNAKTSALVKGEKAKGVAKTERAKAGGVDGIETLKRKQVEKRAVGATKKALQKMVSTRRKKALATEQTALEMQLVDAVEGMSDKDVMKIFQAMNNEGDLGKLKLQLYKSFVKVDKQNKKGQKKVADALGAYDSKKEAVDAILGQIDEARQYQKQLKDTNSALYKQLQAEAQGGTPAGINAISGLEDGYKFVIKGGPQLARSLEKLGSRDRDKVLRAAGVLSAVHKSFWTSNPVFALVFKSAEAIYTPVLTVMTSKGRIRDLANPEVIKEALSKDFGNALKKNGALREGVLDSARTSQTSARILAARGNPFKNMGAYTDLALHDPKALGAKLSEITKMWNNGLRRWSAAATKHRFLEEMGEEGATKLAVHDYNHVLGNFSDATDLARATEAILPYTVAGQAGVRQFAKAFRERPKETMGRVIAFTGLAGLGASSLMSTPEGREYAKDNYDNERALNVDGYITIGTPQKVVDEEGNVTYEGIVKVPIPPDFRPIMGMINRGALDGVDGTDYLDDEFILSSMEGLALGGFLVDPNTGKPDVNEVWGGPLGSVVVAGGYDPQFGNELPEVGDRLEAASYKMGTAGKVLREQDIGAVGESLKNKYVRTKGVSIKGRVYKQSEGYEDLSERMREQGGLKNARRLAIQHNAKIENAIKMVKDAKLSKETRDEFLEILNRRKASLEPYALKKRLEK